MLSMLMYFVNLDFGIHHVQKEIEVTYKKTVFVVGILFHRIRVLRNIVLEMLS